MRTGEKLHEELLIDNLAIDSEHPQIKYANEKYLEWHKLEKILKLLRQEIQKRNRNFNTKSFTTYSKRTRLKNLFKNIYLKGL